MKIAAIVVTYNRKQLLLECLAALLNQTYPLDAIYIIDNASSDGTPELLLEKGYINRVLYSNSETLEDIKLLNLPLLSKTVEIHYIRMHENTGGAGGFAKGIDEGLKNNYDWLWIMDDDCIPKHNALDNLINHKLISQPTTVALCNKVLRVDKSIFFGTRRRIDMNFKETMSNESDYENDYFEINLFSFVGVLLKSESLKKIGLPRKEYFLFFDDTEYSMRLSKIGKIYVIPNSEVVHESPIPTYGKEWQISWRIFFLIRNPIHMYSKYISDSNTNLFKKILLFIEIVGIRSILKPLVRPFVRPIYAGKRITYFKIASKAIYQGITGKFTNDLHDLNRLIKKRH